MKTTEFKRAMRDLLVCWMAIATLAASGGAEERALPGALGPHIKLPPAAYQDIPSFRCDRPLVGTYYFYWYNQETQEHIVDGDGSDALTTHPPTLDGFSYRSVAWHKTQLADMEAAGIDVALPVFWGAPSEHKPGAMLHWSYAGLGPLVEAREALLKEGKQPPRLGLFYDTSTLQYNSWNQHIDLRTDFGRRWFYGTVADFLSMIPPAHWALLDERPIVLLYSAAFAKDHDQTVLDFTKTQFALDFGGRVPFIAAEISWRVQPDEFCAWGGALGLKTPGVASLGPGYDHSAVPGRAPLIVPREDGKFYERNWIKFLRRPSQFLMLETWNEFHEGTDICESREYGRQYIQMTRHFTDLFRRGIRPPWPTGPFTGASEVNIVLGPENRSRGLVQVENEDGATEVLERAGKPARGVQEAPGPARYMYFTVDESFKLAEPATYRLAVTCFDSAEGTIEVEYDGSDRSAPFRGGYTRSPDALRLSGGQTWKTHEFTLPGARFLNSQNRGADFRLVLKGPGIAISEVRLRRK